MKASGPHKQMTVLFVDDEAKSRKYFERAFAGDFRVLTASRSEEAREILEREGDRVALLLTDQRMPAGDGVSLLQHARLRFPHVVRLLTTAYADIDDAIAAVNRGEVRRYITKPWDIATLRQELTEALDAYRERAHQQALLEERRKSMLSVAGHIAHEMRTSLLSIQSAASGVQRYLPRLVEGYRWAASAGAPLEPVRDHHLEVLNEAATGIERVVQRANSVIDLLLANCGGASINPRDFAACRARECIDAALQDYPWRNGERERVALDTGGDFEFMGSQALMVFVLHNLLRNALRAVTAAGGGEVRVGAEAGRGRHRIHVEDTGTGIAEEALPRIFEDFESFTDNGGGAGIGLGFCRRVMESFGGFIECESEPGHTRFDLWLPAMANDDGLRS